MLPFLRPISDIDGGLFDVGDCGRPGGRANVCSSSNKASSAFSGRWLIGGSSLPADARTLLGGTLVIGYKKKFP